MPDAKYHDRREAQERAAAGIALNPSIARLHRQLADKHAELAAAIREHERVQPRKDRASASAET